MTKRGGGRKNRESEKTGKIFSNISRNLLFSKLFQRSSLFKTSKSIIVIDKKLKKISSADFIEKLKKSTKITKNLRKVIFLMKTTRKFYDNAGEIGLFDVFL